MLLQTPMWRKLLGSPRIGSSLMPLDVFSVGGGFCLFVLELVWFAYRGHPNFCISSCLLQTENR